MKKRILALFIAVIMILPLFSFLSSASEVASGSCGDDVNWSLSSEGVLTLEGSGATYNYTGGDTGWYSHASEVKSIVVENGITSIGNYLFYALGSLTSVDIPASVTSIGASAFNSCSNIETITVPDSVTSIGEYAFIMCNKLKTATLSSGITEIPNYLFWSCPKLTSVDIRGNITRIGSDAFGGCSALTAIELPDTLTELGNYVFEYCENLTSIAIPDGVTEIPMFCFYNCTKLGSVTLPSDLKKVGYGAFCDCGSLASVTLPETLEIIEESAFKRTGFTSVEIPGAVTEIGVTAFGECSSLDTVYLPVSLQTIGEGAFAGCTSLADVHYAGFEKDRNDNLTIGADNVPLTDAEWHYKPYIKVTDKFTDVKAGAWYESAVQYVFDYGLFAGTSETTFSPDMPMTRAMLVTVLYRLEGSPEVYGRAPFLDVGSSAWYHDAVLWAKKNSIVSGVGNGRFEPNQNITREQMAAILYRYTDFKGRDVSKRADLSVFPDGNTVSDWAKESMSWANAEGFITGTGVKLEPRGFATRAQVASILMRYCQHTWIVIIFT